MADEPDMSTPTPSSPSGFLPIVAVLACATGLAYVLTANKRAPEPEPQDVVVPLVEAVELLPQTVRFEVASQGTAQPAIETQIVSEVSGTIVSVSDAFVAGGVLKDREVLVSIDPTLFIAERDEARAVLTQRQLEYDGIARLDAGSYRSKVDLATARAALASARAAFTRAQNSLDKTRIRMPYDGVVRSRAVAPGQFVSRGTVIGSVFGSARVEVRLALGQDDLKFLDLPQTGQVSTAAPVRLTGRYRGRDVQWQGQIVRTEGVVDPDNRTTFVVVAVGDPYQQQVPPLHAAPLPAGTFVSARIPGRYMRDVLVLPREAMRGNGRLVFVDADDRLRLRDVPVVRAEAQRVYVRAADVDQRTVVLTTLDTPVNGRKVRVQRVDLAATSSADAREQVVPRLKFLQLDESLTDDGPPASGLQGQ